MRCCAEHCHSGYCMSRRRARTYKCNPCLQGSSSVTGLSSRYHRGYVRRGVHTVATVGVLYLVDVKYEASRWPNPENSFSRLSPIWEGLRVNPATYRVVYYTSGNFKAFSSLSYFLACLRSPRTISGICLCSRLVIGLSLWGVRWWIGHGTHQVHQRSWRAFFYR